MSTNATPAKYAIDVKHVDTINKPHIDVYDVFRGLPNRLDPAIEHAVKKLLNPGGRGAKSFEKDCMEAITSIHDAVIHNINKTLVDSQLSVNEYLDAIISTAEKMKVVEE